MADDKLNEFRDKNIALTKENEALKEAARALGEEVEALRPLKAQLEGVDLAALTAAGLRAAELEKTNAGLAEQLASEKSARAEAQGRAAKSVLRSTIADAFVKSGGKPQATDYIVGKAEAVFEVDESGALKGKGFSPIRPGQRLTVDDFIATQARESEFAFAPSGGGGAAPSRGRSTGAGAVLTNPTPQQLGAHAKEIASGATRVEYSS